MKKMEELRIAFIGVSHWHVPLYLRALKKQKLNIVAVSDPDEEKAKKVAENWTVHVIPMRKLYWKKNSQNLYLHLHLIIKCRNWRSY